LATFLTGKKFATGYKIRLRFHQNKHLVDTKPTWKRLCLMTKVVARYTYDTIVPDKLGFFGPMGQNMRDEQKVYDDMHAPNKEFWWALALVLTVFTAGMLISPVGALWFFVTIALHSQWNLTGQFYAQRYLYLPLVGLCVVAGTALQPYPIAMTAVVTFLVIRTHLFIPAWRNQGAVLKNDLENYPENGQVYNNYAQWIMARGKPMNNIELNELSMNLFKAEKMDPKAWEVQMNLAAFFATVGHWDEAYKRTLQAIDLLRPLGGIKEPMVALETQKANIEKILAEKKKVDAGELGCSLSHQPTDNVATPQEAGRDNGEGKRIETVLESVGAGVA
jgi:hypothetical protein